MSAKILLIINDPSFFISHRLPVAIGAKNAGYDVTVATGPGKLSTDLRQFGLEHRIIPLARSGRNPLQECYLLFSIRALYREVRPDLVHLVTIKPVLYGGLMARWLQVPGMVAAISGMGYLFASGRRGLMRRMAEVLYRLALDHPNGRVIVQNEADRDSLRDIGAIRRHQDILIPGSGVNLDEYWPSPLPNGQALVVLAARMLWDKGIGEFVEAAQWLRERGSTARFVLVGPFDYHNPAAVPLERLKRWHSAGHIEWWGQRDDMPAVLAQASLVILPSYREGLPKVLLEAAACGRPIVTTDTPGCRDVVEPGVNGVLVPVRDVRALANTMEWLLSDRKRLSFMGRCGREKAESEFGVQRVVEAHLAIYRELLMRSRV